MPLQVFVSFCKTFCRRYSKGAALLSLWPLSSQFSGGERGIRTPEELAPLTVFKTVAFDRSAISPSAQSAGILTNFLLQFKKNLANYHGIFIPEY